MCVSTSLMPTPGPPLREREGIMRRGRDAAAGAEAEAEEAGAEGPACEAAAGSVFEGPPLRPSPPPLADVDADEAAAEVVVVVVAAVEFVGAAAAANDTLAAAGSAVDADARLGMGPRRRRGTRWTLLYIYFVRGGREEGKKMRRKAGDEEWTGLGVVGRCLSRALRWPVLGLLIVRLTLRLICKICSRETRQS